MARLAKHEVAALAADRVRLVAALDELSQAAELGVRAMRALGWEREASAVLHDAHARLTAAIEAARRLTG